jgi:ATP-dependent Clp protease ATP-binding subunit ClpX
MNDLPSKENVTKVVVDESVVNGENQPYIIYESEDVDRVAAVEDQRPTGSTY